MMDTNQGPQEERSALDQQESTATAGSSLPASGVADPREATRPGLPTTRSTPARRNVPAQRNVPADDLAPPEILPEAVDEEVLQLAHRIVDLASDKKASDIVLLDVRGQTTMTDYFVICSGASDRQLGAIADGIIEGLDEDGVRPLSREGDASSHWVLIDFGGVIVHVMSVPEREFYQLERLWSRAALLLHIV